jgi:hypothetical protein
MTDFLYLRSLISVLSNWVSFLAYPNLFGLKALLLRSLISMLSDWVSFLAYSNLFGLKALLLLVCLFFLYLSVKFLLKGSLYQEYHDMSNAGCQSNNCFSIVVLNIFRREATRQIYNLVN